jgi:hypothetical protein
MRERVTADGGTLHAGPRSRGGFLVRAHVPLTSGPSGVVGGADGAPSSGAAADERSVEQPADRDVDPIEQGSDRTMLASSREERSA